MKKKRLLAVFAAFAVVATMAVGLTACSKNNTAEGGDDSVLTEEQWVQAWADSLAAKNVSGKVSHGYIYPGLFEENPKNIEFIYDAETHKAYEKHTQNIFEEVLYNYYEVSGMDLIKYQNFYNYEWIGDEQVIESEDWVKWNYSFETEELAKAELARRFNATCWVPEGTWHGEAGDSLVQGTIPELFELFTYDEATHSYSAELYDGDGFVYLNIIITFCEGKISKVNYEGAFPDVTEIMECTLSYGEGSITIPEEVKANALEMY